MIEILGPLKISYQGYLNGSLLKKFSNRLLTLTLSRCLTGCNGEEWDMNVLLGVERKQIHI